MKQSRPLKKKKKERTWAEAATVVLERGNGRSLGIREIQQKIYDYKLKDIKMNKLAENVLKTMLSHHASMENCPFYKVKDRTGYYALKKDYPSYIDDELAAKDDCDTPVEEIADEDSNGSGNSIGRPTTRRRAATPSERPTPESPKTQNENTEAADNRKLLKNKALANAMTRRSNSYTGSAIQKSRFLSRRRVSSPMLSSFQHTSLRRRPTNNVNLLHRSRSSGFLQRAVSSSNNKSRSLPTLDLETPNSVLTNTKLKSIVNSTTFSMLPASYQFKLIQLLPKVDQVIDKDGVPRIAPTALNNEFFSQAIQDWATQLSEGEFTRETQARIMQEIAKERSKISPWKEKFFEEFYGQKTEVKRSRSRSHDATSNLADLSFEAQVTKFQHLRDSLERERSEMAEEEEGLIEVVSDEQDSESEHDPDYMLGASSTRTVGPRRYPVGLDTMKEDPKVQTAKPINRRKINKPFKRTVYNSLEERMQGTALMHRKAIVHHRSAFSYPRPRFDPVSDTFRPGALLTGRPSFQIREEFYHSDNELSDTGELSDSNSFHQHDSTDEGEDSSEEMMNMGDDNLLDVDDEETDSDEFGGISDSIHSDLVSAEHSYTRTLKRRRKSSDERLWRRPRVAVGSVMPVSSKDESKMGPSNSPTTLVLRPRGNLGQTVQAITFNEDSSSTSPEQPFKKSCITQPMFGKILTVSKAETSKEERVGVLFSREVQSSPRGYHGDAIVPRITMTSSLISSPVTPTTVCTSNSSQKSDTGTVVKQVKRVVTGSPICHTNASETAKAPVTKATTSDTNVTLTDIAKTTSDIVASKSGFTDTPSMNVTVASSSAVTEPSDSLPRNGQSSTETLHATRSTDSNAMTPLPKTASPAECISVNGILPVAAQTQDTKITDNAQAPNVTTNLVPTETSFKNVSSCQSVTGAIATVCNATATSNSAPTSANDTLVTSGSVAPTFTEKVTGVERNTSPVLMSRVRRKSESLSPVKPIPITPPKSSPVLLPSLQHSPAKKRPLPTNSSSPVKRTRTLAEIKAQMKAKRLAAASMASPGNSATKPVPSAQAPTARLSATPVQGGPSPQVVVKQQPTKTEAENTKMAKISPRSSPILSSSRTRSFNDDAMPKKESGADATSVEFNADDDATVKKQSIAKSDKPKEAAPKVPGKIILKIKSEEGKKYSVKVKTGDPSPQKCSGTDSDDTDEVVVRKSRRLSHLISSSDDSSDGATGASTIDKNASVAEAKPGTDTRSTFTQSPILGSFSGNVVSVMDHHLLLKKTQKSPVFGEPAFEGITPLASKTVISSLPSSLASEISRPDDQSPPKLQPFMSDKPVIGFQDIPSCTALSSNVPVFVSPTTIIPPSQDSQKYRSTSKGKSLLQMQQLARSIQSHSDESEIAESDSEDEETVSTTSSAEDEDPPGPQINGPTTGKLTPSHYPYGQNKTKENGVVGSLQREERGSDCEESYSSSSSDDPAIVTDCICACKRLVLCKGCGAYTHEECLSSTSLCSLCV